VIDINPWAIVAGYGWGILAGGFVVPRMMILLRTEPIPLDENDEQQKDPAPEAGWHREGLGIVERAVFVTAVLLESEWLAGAWLVFKAASAWGAWSKAPGIFNRYAIGTALSIAFGASGGVLAFALSHGDRLQFGAAVGGPVVLTLLVISVYRGPLRPFWAPPA
jgi:hypothetical protein